MFGKNFEMYLGRIIILASVFDLIMNYNKLGHEDVMAKFAIVFVLGCLFNALGKIIYYLKSINDTKKDKEVFKESEEFVECIQEENDEE